MSLILESTYQIRFDDCDAFQHLNNMKYLRIFFTEREDHEMLQLGFDMYQYQKETQKNWVIGMNQIAYFRPGFLMEKVVIQSTIIEWNPTDYLMEMYMWDVEKTQMKALFWCRMIHFDFTTNKRATHDAFLNQKLGIHVNPLSQPMTFEERVRTIKKKR